MGTTYQDAFTGEGLDPTRDAILEVTVFPLGEKVIFQQFYVKRETFASVIHESIPLGDVFDDANK